jgi:hypothetical protein
VIRSALVSIAVTGLFAAVPAGASAASIGDYSCDIESLTVQNELDNGGSGSFTATGSAQCWTDDPTQKFSAQLTASGTYRAQKCSLISVAQPSYLRLTGSLTITPDPASGQPAGTTGVTISTADLGTSNRSVGTITLDSGQTGPVQVSYANPVLGVIARCGGDPFSPVYSGTFLAS